MPIPYGYCHCGCGNKTKLSDSSNAKRGWVKGKPRKYLQGHHGGNWKGGISNSRGYTIIYNPDHLRARRKGYVLEHIAIAQKALGKELPIGSVVHHENGSKNSGSLIICQDQSYHMLLHQRERALKECGHANWRKCKFCKKYDDPINLYISPSRKNVYHRICIKEYERKRKMEKYDSL